MNWISQPLLTSCCWCNSMLQLLLRPGIFTPICPVCVYGFSTVIKHFFANSTPIIIINFTHWFLQLVPKRSPSFNIHVHSTHWSSERFKTAWHHLYLNSEVFRAVAIKYAWHLLGAVKIQAKNSCARIRSLPALCRFAPWQSMQIASMLHGVN